MQRCEGWEKDLYVVDIIYRIKGLNLEEGSSQLITMLTLPPLSLWYQRNLC
jgi:hypothetical protein